MARQVKAGEVLIEWDPSTFSILTEEAGTVRFKDILDGLTVHEEVDEVTGLSRRIIMDSPDEKKQPLVEIRDAANKVSRAVSHAVACPPDGGGRRFGDPGRGAGEDPARHDQDEGHHGRSAARGRALRGAQAA